MSEFQTVSESELESVEGGLAIGPTLLGMKLIGWLLSD